MLNEFYVDKGGKLERLFLGSQCPNVGELVTVEAVDEAPRHFYVNDVVFVVNLMDKKDVHPLAEHYRISLTEIENSPFT